VSRELLELMKRVKVQQYKENPPLKTLYEIYHEIETTLHYGRYRTWEILVELLANWIVEKEDYSLGCQACKAFAGLELHHKDLYNNLKDLDLFNAYVTAARNDPWDHMGEIFLEQELAGPGQNLTPRAVVELMTKMVYATQKLDGEAEFFCYDSYLQHKLWYTLTYHAPPIHLKPMDLPVHTQLDI